MTAGILAILIEAHRGVPLFIIIADVMEAYDNVWRDALLSSQGRKYPILLTHMIVQLVTCKGYL